MSLAVRARAIVMFRPSRPATNQNAAATCRRTTHSSIGAMLPDGGAERDPDQGTGCPVVAPGRRFLAPTRDSTLPTTAMKVSPTRANQKITIRDRLLIRPAPFLSA